MGPEKLPMIQVDRLTPMCIHEALYGFNGIKLHTEKGINRDKERQTGKEGGRRKSEEEVLEGM